MCQLIERRVRRRQKEQVVRHARRRRGSRDPRRVDNTRPRGLSRSRWGSGVLACTRFRCRARPSETRLLAVMNLYTNVLTSSLRHASRTHRLALLPRGVPHIASAKPIVWRRQIATPSQALTASLTEQSRPPSLVQFLSSRFLRATHRSRTVSSSRARSPYTPSTLR